jgi:hypothetical protein
MERVRSLPLQLTLDMLALSLLPTLARRAVRAEAQVLLLFDRPQRKTAGDRNHSKTEPLYRYHRLLEKYLLRLNCRERSI